MLTQRPDAGVQGDRVASPPAEEARRQQFQGRKLRLEARIAAKKAQRSAEGEVVCLGLLAERVSWSEAVRVQKIAERHRRAALEQEVALRQAAEEELAASEAAAREQHAALLALAAERDRENDETSLMKQEDDAAERMRMHAREVAEMACMELEDARSRSAMAIFAEEDWTLKVSFTREAEAQRRRQLAEEEEAMAAEDLCSQQYRSQVCAVRREYSILVAQACIESVVAAQAHRRAAVLEEAQELEVQVQLERAARDSMAVEDALSHQRECFDRALAEEQSWQAAVASQKASIQQQRLDEQQRAKVEVEVMAAEDLLGYRLRQAEAEAQEAARQTHLRAAVSYVARVAARSALRADATAAWHKERCDAEEEAVQVERQRMLHEEESSSQYRTWMASEEVRLLEKRETARMHMEDERAWHLRDVELRRRRQEEREFSLRKADHMRRRQEAEALRLQLLAAEEEAMQRKQREDSKRLREIEERARAAQRALAAESARQQAAAEQAEQTKLAREEARRRKLLEEDNNMYNNLYSQNRSQVSAFRSMEHRGGGESESDAGDSPRKQHIVQVPQAPHHPRSTYRRPSQGRVAQEHSPQGSTGKVESPTARAVGGDELAAVPPNASSNVWWLSGHRLDVDSLLADAEAGISTSKDHEPQSAIDPTATFFTEG
mmetsp:Transcript_46358/g.110384  ORF Transcript_46358/g.110384 Transcript_46358/m.110384 type:complete len:667 (+) Transcript_46358:159-2159(+)